MMISDFNHLHVHTMYSLLDGYGKPEQYARRAADLGYSHLAITDHGNIDGALHFQKACKKSGITPIFGVEFYIVPDAKVKEKGEKRNHVVALARNKLGWKNLMRLVSYSNLTGFYYKPRIDAQALLDHMDGLIILSGCFLTPLNTDWGMELFTCPAFQEFNHDSFYVEIMPHQIEGQEEVNKICVDFSETWGNKIVATNDLHYMIAEQSKSHEVLLAVQTKKKWEDEKRFRFSSDGFYMKTKNDMSRSFRRLGGVEPEIVTTALENTKEVIEKCQDFTKIDGFQISLPSVPGIGAGEDDKELKRLCNKNFSGLIARDSRSVRKYSMRLKEELETVHKQDFARYFLIVYELIRWCKDNDIMIGPGRGSSSGSLICYLLGITKVDPIKYGLFFARFINPERIDLPDIDIDFEDIKKPIIREHLEEIYGKWNVAGVSTFSRMKGRGAIKDVSRVFDVPFLEVNKVSSIIPQKMEGEEGWDNTIAEAFTLFEDGIQFKKKYPKISEIAMEMEGRVRSKGQHASAVIVADEDLRDTNRTAFVLGKDKMPMINWTKEDAEKMGLMKLDILGLNMLTVLNHCKKLVKDNYGKKIHFPDLPLDEENCYEEFSQGNTIGCFQLGSPGLRKFVRRLGVEDFDLLVAATSLYRPGTLHSGNADLFIKRKKGEEEVPRQHRMIEAITKDTYGIVLYQEQMMSLIFELAGWEWSTVDKLRKIVGKSKGVDAFMEYEEQFVRGCVENKTIGENYARELWDTLSKMGAYQFNKAHAVAYSMITYWCMFMKVYYPTEYFCSLLSYGSSEEDKKDEYIEEAFRLGLEIRTPKVGISGSHQWVIHENRLYCPFIEIKGIGEKTAAAFLNLDREKKEGFFENNGKKRKISSKFMTILDEIKAYEDIEVEDFDLVSQYFSFNFSKDKFRKYKRLRTSLERNLEIKKMEDLDLNKIDNNKSFYLGIVSKIYLNYFYDRDGKRKSNANAIFKDETGDNKISFPHKFYEKKKDLIEHCEKQLVLILASSPFRPGQILVNDAWFESELKYEDIQNFYKNIRKNRF